jgi:hypothetical protein
MSEQATLKYKKLQVIIINILIVDVSESRGHQITKRSDVGSAAAWADVHACLQRSVQLNCLI